MIRRLQLLSPLPLLAVLLLGASCAVPLAWLCWQIAGEPATLRLLRPSAVRWDILGRTCAFSVAAAAVATVLAVPVAAVVGGQRTRTTRILAFLLPLTLLLPSLVYAYGWAQFFRLLMAPMGQWLASTTIDRSVLTTLGLSLVGQGGDAKMYLVNAGPADVARCVWSLATWLWPIPAAAMAWALRRADPTVAQQAQLDGARVRVAARQVLPAAMIAFLSVWVLASQEFAVYEPTGVSVVATEVRMVFETGSFSSGQNPMTAPLGVGGGPAGGGMFGAESRSPSIMPADGSGDTSFEQGQDVQQRAAAAAVATGVPMLLLTAVAGSIVVWACRRWSAESDEINDQPSRPVGLQLQKYRNRTDVGRAASPVLPGPVPARRGQAGYRPTLAGFLAFVIVAVTSGIPVASMLLRHQRSLDPVKIWQQSGYLVLGSLQIAVLAGGAAIAIAAAAVQRRPRWMLVLAVASFLVGGQLLAIALIRLYNRPQLGWVYNAPPIMVMAYLGRFGWLALLAAAVTWSRPWRVLRQQAQLDGASEAQIACRVLMPVAWPLVAGAGVLVLVLSLTEVPATVLAAPFRPPQIIPMLMTWVHTLESDPMIEASLLLAAVAMLLSALGAATWRLGTRVAPSRPHEAGANDE